MVKNCIKPVFLLYFLPGSALRDWLAHDRFCIVGWKKFWRTRFWIYYFLFLALCMQWYNRLTTTRVHSSVTKRTIVYGLTPGPSRATVGPGETFLPAPKHFYEAPLGKFFLNFSLQNGTFWRTL